jgi:hypothetical protein
MSRRYDVAMRTTVDLHDDVLVAARAIASTRRSSLGKVISELARRGLAPPAVTYDDIPRFAVPADAPPITDEMVAAALDED